MGYTPNEIAIFHRDNDQQNHWVFWGTLFSDKPISTSDISTIQKKLLKKIDKKGGSRTLKSPSHPMASPLKAKLRGLRRLVGLRTSWADPCVSPPQTSSQDTFSTKKKKHLNTVAGSSKKKTNSSQSRAFHLRARRGIFLKPGIDSC